MNPPIDLAIPQKPASEAAQKTLDTAKGLADAGQEIGNNIADQAESTSKDKSKTSEPNATGCKCQKQ